MMEDNTELTDSVIDRAAPGRDELPSPVRSRPGSWSLAAGFICGALPGALLARWDATGIGVAVGGAIIGVFVVYERIGFVRLLVLGLFPFLGQIADPVADKALEVTEEDPDRLPADDLLTVWLLSGSRMSRPWAIAGGLLIGALACGVIAAHDWLAIAQHQPAWLFPLWQPKDITVHCVYLTYCSSAVTGTLATLLFSPAHRRPLLLAGCVGTVFGLIPGLSAGAVNRLVWPFLIMALFATQCFMLLFAVCAVFEPRVTLDGDEEL